MNKDNQVMEKLQDLRKRRIFVSKVCILYKKCGYYNAWEIWFKNAIYGDEYIRDISAENVYSLCAEVQSQRDILNMTPYEFTSAVWALCCSKIFNDCAEFRHFSDDDKEFHCWLNKEIIDWYCEMIQGLI